MPDSPQHNGSGSFQQKLREIENELDPAAFGGDKDAYLKALYQAIRERTSPDDWQDFNRDDYTISWEDVLAAARRLTNRNGS